MTAIAKNKIEQFMPNIIALAKEGKYGEAACQINDIFLSSDEDLKKAIKDAMREKEMEDQAVTACCECCSECKCDTLASVYCVGFIVTFFCCGDDVASSCCGCDWMIDSSSSCVRDQCC